VGINRTCDFKSPDFLVALNTIWGNEIGIDLLNAPDCVSVIKGVLSAETTKVSIYMPRRHVHRFIGHEGDSSFQAAG